MNILSIAEYTVKENIRGKIFYILLLFSIIMIGSALIFSSLSPDTETRVITDLGLGCIELFSFLAGIFAAVNLILQEIDNRTIYLLITRPLRRWEYILGRYFGVLTIIFLNILIMFGALFLLLVTKIGIAGFNHMILWSLVTIFFKIGIIVAIALAFSLVFSSTISAMIFSFFIWTIGHFSVELNILSNKATNVFTKILLKILYYLLPNFQYLNLKDRLYIPEGMPTNIIALVLVYSLVYIIIMLVMASLMFSRKEF